jgi:beta-glucosidase
MTRIVFPPNFLWGVATSAPQIEGAWDADGRGESIWDRFSKLPGKIYNGDTPAVACDHYHLYETDVAEMVRLGVKTYRFSFAWPRILPQGTGPVNQKGLDFYKRLVDQLLKAGIVPNATLYHWDLPQALEDRGGWPVRDSVDWYEEYAGLLFETFGDQIKLWATFNEPIAIWVGYGAGAFAPGHQSEKLARQAIHHLLLAHGRAVRAFRSLDMGTAKIGIVIDVWRRLPVRDRPDDPGLAEDRELARLEEETTYRYFMSPIFKGHYPQFALDWLEKQASLPVTQAGDMEIIASPIDYIGVNCYSVYRVSTDPELVNPEKLQKEKPGLYTDVGWEVYPRSIYEAVMTVRQEFSGDLPIYLTENGACFPDLISEDGRVHDPRRVAYFQAYLAELYRAIQDGADVRGYYAWSLMDNFEWTAGYSKRFGLLYTDYPTQGRIWKDSAYWFQKTIRENGFEV